MKNARIQKIKQLFLVKKEILNTELCEAFNVSIETIRRDLNQLEREGFIVKKYGGAKLVESSVVSIDLKNQDLVIPSHCGEKISIAKSIVDMIPNGSTVFLDSGTTILALAPLLKNKINLTVLTNSLHVASELNSCENITTYMIGGVLRCNQHATTGYFAQEFLSCFYHIDYAIVSGDNLIASKGLIEYSSDIASLKRTVLKKADYIVVAIDHSKINSSSNGNICCDTNKIDILVTDSDTPADVIRSLVSKGIDVRIARLESSDING